MVAAIGEAPRLRRLRKKTTVPVLKTSSVESAKPAASQKTNGVPATSSATRMRRGRFLLKDRHPDYAIIKQALSDEDLRRLDGFLRLQTPEPARMKNEGGGEDDHERKVDYNDRDCKVFWFHMEEHCRWLQKHFEDIIRDVGNVEWPLLKVNKRTGNVICEWEQTQYTTYGPGQHFFCWHQDAYADGHDQEDARQLTLVVMLSEREEYTEGAFEMKLPPKSGMKGRFSRKIVRLDAGDVIAFPAKKLVHRVQPVGTGTRRTLVFWANDKQSCHFYNPRLKNKKNAK